GGVRCVTRAERMTPRSSPSQLPRLLSRLAHASRSREGRAPPPPCRATRARRYRGSASSRRTPPPLHPLRCVATVVQLFVSELSKRSALARDPRPRLPSRGPLLDSLSAAVLEGHGR